jgi:hypothetical protein
MTIINDSADMMPNVTREFSQKRVDNLKILLSAYNWDHIRVVTNLVSLLELSLLIVLHLLWNVVNP